LLLSHHLMPLPIPPRSDEPSKIYPNSRLGY
jgi:hypothetical protein